MYTVFFTSLIATSNPYTYISVVSLECIETTTVLAHICRRGYANHGLGLGLGLGLEIRVWVRVRLRVRLRVGITIF